MERTNDQALQQGVAAHKKGKLQEAEHLCRAILGSQPSHPDAKHNLGLLAVSFNRVDIAVPLFKTALEANPKIEQFWLSPECKDNGPQFIIRPSSPAFHRLAADPAGSKLYRHSLRHRTIYKFINSLDKTSV